MGVAPEVCYLATHVVAWTVADLQGLTRPDRDSVEQALYFRDRRAA